MRFPRLLQTTAVRLAVRYALIYALVLGLALMALRWASNRHINAQLRTSLKNELSLLTQKFASGGPHRLTVAVMQRQEQGIERDRFYLLLSPDGNKRAGNLFEWPDESPILLDGKVHNLWVEEGLIPGQLYGDDAYLPVVAKAFPDGSRLLLIGGAEQSEALQEITDFIFEVLGVAVLLALVMAITMGHAILGRMDTISRTANEIMAGDLSKRVPVSGKHDEFDALAGRLNTMLDRIQRLIQGMREVTDNIAHDLRSPLTRLQSRLEVTLLEPREEQEYRQVIQQSINDAESLIKTFNALLGIAQAEAGNHRAQWGQVDLNRLAADLMELYRPAAEAQYQALDFHGSENARITGSRDLLAQAVGNLLDNAIKHTPKGGTLRLRVRPCSDAVEISVADTGPGIPEAERKHVLQRFVRLEGSRHTPGNGLGLSLVQAVAKLHQAELLLEDARPGLRVTLRFPNK